MERPNALVLDDEPDICELIKMTLSRMNINVQTALTLANAKKYLKSQSFDFALTDMRLPDGDGLDLVKLVQADYAQMPIAVITAHGNMETAITALKYGAFDFVSKPIELQMLRDLVSSALKLKVGNRSNLAEDTEAVLIGQSNAMKQLKDTLLKVARSQAPIYISGPSGAGKELVAKLIHANSPRYDQAFIPVNCGAIPNNLMESEFFGHKKGSFTGAHSDKIGLFQAAHRGTLFLDEIADLPIDMQVKFLRAIQEKSIRPVGSAKEVPIDVRIVSATHHNLLDRVRQNLFRQDLFYRLNVIELKVPSLKERMEDLPLLASFFLNKISKNTNKKNISLSKSALESLSNYSFPGNVRELENILERAFTLSEGDIINVEDLQLPENDITLTSEPVTKDLENYLDRIERDAIYSALEKAKWNKTKAAQLLGISFRALRYRLKKLGLTDDKKDQSGADAH